MRKLSQPTSLMVGEGTVGDRMPKMSPSKLWINVAMGTLVVPVAWLGLGWLWARATVGPSSASYEWNAFVLYSLVLMPQVGLATLLQQGVLLLIPAATSSTRVRLVGTIAETVAVAVVTIVAGGELDPVVSPEALATLALAAALFSAAMRLPLRRPDQLAPDERLAAGR